MEKLKITPQRNNATRAKKKRKKKELVRLLRIVNNPFLKENYFKGRKIRVNVSLIEKYVELGHGFRKHQLPFPPHPSL